MTHTPSNPAMKTTVVAVVNDGRAGRRDGLRAGPEGKVVQCSAVQRGVVQPRSGRREAPPVGCRCHKGRLFEADNDRDSERKEKTKDEHVVVIVVVVVIAAAAATVVAVVAAAVVVVVVAAAAAAAVVVVVTTARVVVVVVVAAAGAAVDGERHHQSGVAATMAVCWKADNERKRRKQNTNM